MHRPGLELTRLTPRQRRRAALRRRACGRSGPGRSTTRSSQKLRDKGVVVHHFADLLAEALDEPGAREFVQDRLRHRDTGSARRWTRRCDELVGARRRPTAGRVPHRRRPQAGPAPAATRRSLLLEYLDADDFLLRAAAQPPVPARQLGLGLRRRCRSTRWPSRPASGRRSTPGSSTTSTRCSRDAARCTSTTATTTSAHEPATCEGGDILVIGNGAVMIGMGERTTPQGVEFLARQYFAHGTVDQGHRRRAAEDAGVHAPRHRDDDGRPRRVQRLPLPARTTLRSFTLTPVGDGGDYQVERERRPVPGGRRGARRRQGPRAADADRRARRRSASSGTTATTSSPSPRA